MPVAWDVNIPDPVNSLNIEQGDVSARTGDQFGVKTTRRRMTNAPAQISTEFILTAAEKVLFDTFYLTTTNHGLIAFTADWLSVARSPHHIANINNVETQVIGKNASGLLYKIAVQFTATDVGEVIEGYSHPFYDPEAE